MTDQTLDDGQEPDAETYLVEPERLGGPVDAPDEHRTMYANVVQRRDEPLRPIVPAEWRNPEQRRQVLRWMAWYGWYQARFHAVRLPKYTAKAAVWTPVGAGRGLARAVRWASAEEGNWHLRQEAARRNQPEMWLALDRHRQRSASWRWWIFAGAALVAAVAVALLLLVAPWWCRWVVVAVAVPMLARLGRPADKPITDRVSTGPRFTKLTAEMVRNALVAIGLSRIKDPGDLRFAEPGIHRDGPGWLARVNLPAGVDVSEVLEKRRHLSSALRLPVDQVWPAAGPEHAGQLDLWVGYLPASKMGQPRWSLSAPTARTSVFESHEFGTDQRQRPVKTALFARNFLIGGVPGSGKSYGARTLAIMAALDPTAELKICEFKGTADFGDLAPLCSTYACGVDDEAFSTGAELLRWGLAEAERRGKRIRAAKARGEAPHGKVTPELAARPGSGLHPIVIVIDEAHELFGDSEHGAEAATNAERLIKRGRALAIIVILATQIPDRKSLPSNITRCVTVRWCMAVQDQVANDMILGTGAYKRGLTGTAYRPGEDAGWGIVTGLAEPTAVRSQFPDEATTKAIIARATALRGGEPVGSDLAAVPARDVLDDVMRVFAHLGRPAVQWQKLAELLAGEHPDVYARHTPESLSALVRAAGVPSKDVRAGGQTLMGCRREDVEAAVERREVTDGRS